jgi:hypothetical protein
VKQQAVSYPAPILLSTSICDTPPLVAVFPAHSTRRLQPLDVRWFGPLATYYSQSLDAHSRLSRGLATVTKRDFFNKLYSAIDSAFTETNIGLNGSRPASNLSTRTRYPRSSMKRVEIIREPLKPNWYRRDSQEAVQTRHLFREPSERLSTKQQLRGMLRPRKSSETASHRVYSTAKEAKSQGA